MDNFANRKPRRTRGTVLHRVRNYYATGVVAVGIVCGYLFHITGCGQKINKYLTENYGDLLASKREPMEILAPRRTRTLKKFQRDSKDN